MIKSYTIPPQAEEEALREGLLEAYEKVKLRNRSTDRNTVASWLGRRVDMLEERIVEVQLVPRTLIVDVFVNPNFSSYGPQRLQRIPSIRSKTAVLNGNGHISGKLSERVSKAEYEFENLIDYWGKGFRKVPRPFQMMGDDEVQRLNLSYIKGRTLDGVLYRFNLELLALKKLYDGKIITKKELGALERFEARRTIIDQTKQEIKPSDKTNIALEIKVIEDEKRKLLEKVYETLKEFHEVGRVILKDRDSGKKVKDVDMVNEDFLDRNILYIIGLATWKKRRNELGVTSDPVLSEDQLDELVKALEEGFINFYNKEENLLDFCHGSCIPEHWIISRIPPYRSQAENLSHKVSVVDLDEMKRATKETDFVRLFDNSLVNSRRITNALYNRDYYREIPEVIVAEHLHTIGLATLNQLRFPKNYARLVSKKPWYNNDIYTTWEISKINGVFEGLDRESSNLRRLADWLNKMKLLE